MLKSQTMQEEFRTFLSSAIKIWASLRHERIQNKQTRFLRVLKQWLSWSEKSKLPELNHVLKDIIAKLENINDIDDKLIAHVNTQLNFLFASVKKSPNPYLVPASTPAQKSLDAAELNIAIIDDSEIARVSTKAMLDRFNFDVNIFESIFEFEENETALRNTDLVLLDVVMPDVDEDFLFEFARRLRRRDIHVILVSATDSLDLRLRAVRADIGGYITKPFDINVLVGNIRWICNLDVERPFQVLLLDDQPMVGLYLDSFAKQNDIILRYYAKSTDFFEELDLGVPDMFILDIQMPEISGLEVCKILRQQQRFEYVPIVFLSADDRLDTKLLALEAGADDVIIKHNPPDIIFKQIERRIMRGQQIRNLAIKDSLTGLYNHGQMMDAAESALRLATRNQSAISVAMIDIDNFKQVNDQRGHIIGDQVIVGLAQLLKTSVRESDVVGRYGGEEFLIVFHSDDQNAIKRKVDNIRASFEKIQFKDGNEFFHCTFSCGIASSRHAEKLKEIIKIADQTMYEVKREGKNDVKVA